MSSARLHTVLLTWQRRRPVAQWHRHHQLARVTGSTGAIDNRRRPARCSDRRPPRRPTAGSPRDVLRWCASSPTAPANACAILYAAAARARACARALAGSRRTSSTTSPARPSGRRLDRRGRGGRRSVEAHRRQGPPTDHPVDRYEAAAGPNISQPVPNFRHPKAPRGTRDAPRPVRGDRTSRPGYLRNRSVVVTGSVHAWQPAVQVRLGYTKGGHVLSQQGTPSRSSVSLIGALGRKIRRITSDYWQIGPPCEDGVAAVTLTRRATASSSRSNSPTARTPKAAHASAKPTPTPTPKPATTKPP